MCQFWNGGCAKVAKCSQTGQKVSCTCPKGHSGDGFTCLPIDPCSSGDNGGCHEHSTCTMTAPVRTAPADLCVSMRRRALQSPSVCWQGKRRCSCKDGYVGDGVTCEVKQLPISRCLQDNGQCHQDAKCSDLHFEGATVNLCLMGAGPVGEETV